VSAGGQLVVANGLDAATGEPLASMDEADFTDRVLELIRGETMGGLAAGAGPGGGRQRALPWEIPPTDLARAGWSIVFTDPPDPAVRDALQALIDHRRGTVQADNLHVHTYRPGEPAIDWLNRHGVNPGIVDPSRVGYYLLLVGSPVDIPFDVQYLLDLDYAVGRLHFDTPSEYARYVESVIAAESGDVRRDRVAAFWAPRHSGDPATQLSADHLAMPLSAGSDEAAPGVAARQGFRPWRAIGADATRSRLLDMLGGRDATKGRPAFLLTASHGLGGVPAGQAEQRTLHGALVSQERRPGQPVTAEARITGDDVADVDVHGLISFFFACYGAGTPAFDSFRDGDVPARRIALEPFVARLPAALLAHPRGGALACIGHVERTWTCSIRSAGGSRLSLFEDVIGQVLAGRPIGHALGVLGNAYAILSTTLSQQVRSGESSTPLGRRRLLDLWLERTDAQNYILLGDPAVRLPLART
jgi:hypothetical protein